MRALARGAHVCAALQRWRGHDALALDRQHCWSTRSKPHCNTHSHNHNPTHMHFRPVRCLVVVFLTGAHSRPALRVAFMNCSSSAGRNIPMSRQLCHFAQKSTCRVSMRAMERYVFVVVVSSAVVLCTYQPQRQVARATLPILKGWVRANKMEVICVSACVVARGVQHI